MGHGTNGLRCTGVDVCTFDPTVTAYAQADTARLVLSLQIQAMGASLSQCVCVGQSCPFLLSTYVVCGSAYPLPTNALTADGCSRGGERGLQRC